MQDIHIAIADDHPMIADGLQHILAAHPHIVLENVYNSGAELMTGLAAKQPDVLLLDLQFTDTTGNKLAPEILKQYPGVRILVLTGIDSALYIYNMLKEGASGYVLKNSASSVIVNAIETVHAGGIYLEQTLQEKLERFRDKLKNKKTLKPSLTVKEREVLELTVQGYSIPEISEKIFLGRRTIEYYRSNLLLKFDVRNVAELIRKVIETGILD